MGQKEKYRYFSRKVGHVDPRGLMKLLIRPQRSGVSGEFSCRS
jgi:hypothetical protein